MRELAQGENFFSVLVSDKACEQECLIISGSRSLSTSAALHGRAPGRRPDIVVNGPPLCALESIDHHGYASITMDASGTFLQPPGNCPGPTCLPFSLISPGMHSEITPPERDASSAKNLFDGSDRMLLHCGVPRTEEGSVWFVRLVKRAADYTHPQRIRARVCSFAVFVRCTRRDEQKVALSRWARR